MLPVSDTTDQKFYPAPPSWFGKYVGPWLFFAVASAMLIYFWQDEPRSFGAHIGFGLAQAFFAFVLYMVLTDKSVTCFTIGTDHVTKEEGGQTKTLLFSEIKGFSERTTKDSTFTLIEPLDSKQRSIQVNQNFVGYDELRQQLARHVPDFDAPERERHERALAQATEVLLHDQRLGFTPEARQATLDRALVAVSKLVLAAVPLTLWVLVGWPFDLAMAAGLLLPLLALAALWQHRAVATFAGSRDDPRPDVLVPIALPSALLAVRSTAHFDYLDWQPLLPMAAAIGGTFALLLLAGSWRNGPETSPLKQVGLAVLLAGCYGWAAAVVANGALGGAGAPARFITSVTDKYRTTGKGGHDYLMLDSQRPVGVPDHLAVGSTYYHQKQPGDTVTLRRYQGRLGAAWVTVAAEE